MTSQNFYTPPVFSAPAGGGDPVGIDTHKTRMIGLLYGEEIMLFR